MSKKGFGTFALGAGIGATLALLFAPKKGTDLRSDIKKKISELTSSIEEIDAEDVKREFNKKVNELKKDLEDLDGEKILKVAKKKGEELKQKSEELLSLAKEKGTPVLEGIAEDLKQKTIAVAEEVIKKLEEK